MPDETEQALIQGEEFVNSLSGLCETIRSGVMQFAPPEISTSDTLWYNLRWYLISNLRQLVTQLYVEHGIVQTLVDQPVDDAFRSGFEIKSGQLDGDDIEQLEVFEQRNKVIANLIQGIKWSRLFGGGGVLIITDQNPMTPLNIKSITEKTPLEFRSVDMWELYYGTQNVQGTLEVGGKLGESMGEFYDYYGHKIHKSRVYRIEGKEPPSFVRPRLRGWGMSELERLVRSLNQYLKNQDVIFELLDEAKVDVYKITGFNTAMLTGKGTTDVAKRIQGANLIKNFNSALTMDKNDDYEQKQIAFSGLADILLQIRQGVAADLKMPMTKLFGVSAAGFSSGEDDIENYNSMLESEIRSKNRFTVVDLLQICCQKVFGHTIDDLQIDFKPLRILNAKEEEEVKDSQFNRTMSAYSSGLIPAEEAKEALNKGSLLPIEVDVTAEAGMPIGGSPDEFKVEGSAKGKGGKQAQAEA